MKKKLMLGILVFLSLFYFNVKADDEISSELNNPNEVLEESPREEKQEDETPNEENTTEEKEGVVDDLGSTPLQENETPSENLEVEEKGEETPTENLSDGEKEDTTPTDNIPSTEEETPIEPHKVAVITTKVDEFGKMLSGATLQILDSDGNVVDEWVSDGKEHETLLPEGEYILRETKAPEGYAKAEDKTFNVEVVINEITAGTDHDANPDVCKHYGGVPLYYVESKGVKQEVYCLNQGLEEPDVVSYNGTVLTADNIKKFAPDADSTMSGSELYNKVLDVAYRRSKANEKFDLSETEIRFVTERAIKNYTSALLRENDKNNYYMFRDYRYDPSVNTGYVVDQGNGDAIGQLAKHWYVYHGHKKLPSTYAELFYYLINDDGIDKHPGDMHFYVYASNSQVSEDEAYQNLIGITWFNPYDDDHKVEVSLTNKAITKATITKVWDDAKNQDGIRPDSVDATLSNGTTVTLNEDNNWTATVENLPVYENGEKIEYTWSEVKVDGYTLTDTKVDGFVTTITNTHKPATTEINVLKVWADDDNESKKRPENVSVSLLADGEEYQTVTLSMENEWKHIFSDLPVYENGKEILYTVQENNVPEGYVASIEKDEQVGFIIHNILGQGGDVPPTDNPQTGDNVLNYLFTLLISLMGLIIGTVYIKKYN